VTDELSLDSAIVAGAVAALRKRAARQRAIVEAGVVMTETGVMIRAGEAAVAARLAEAFAALADEIEREAP
jgi:hypothetical protein